MQLRLCLIIFNIFFAVLDCGAQFQWNSKKDKMILPFELTHNLIIADVVVNDVDLKMIFDTGSERNLLFSFPENDSIAFYETEKVRIRGLGHGEYLYAYLSKKNTLKINSIISENVAFLLVTDQEISLVNKLGVPVNGIIGADFFKDFLVEVDYQRKKIILHKDTEKILLKKAKRFDKKKVEVKDNRPFITLNGEVNDRAVALKLLVDTGLGDGLWLFENDSIHCNENYFVDVLGRGLGGEIKGKKSRVEALYLNDMKFEEALVSYPDSISKTNLVLTEGRNGSLGGGITKRFNWLFDYKNETFYFKKNNLFDEPFHYNMSGIEVQHKGIEIVKEGFIKQDNSRSDKTILFDDTNAEYIYRYTLKPSFEIYAVRENSPAYFAGLNVGDKIISINGKKAYHYTIQKITDLFQSEEGKKIEIVIERNGKEMDFEFYLEKVL